MYLVQAGSRQDVAQSALRTVAHRVVIRVEQIAERGMKRPETLHVLREHERLEEPGGMRQVPLRRAGISHGLKAVVLDSQGCADLQRGVAQLQVAGHERILARAVSQIRTVSSLLGHRTR